LIELLLQTAINGTALASIYLLFGLSFSIIYSASGVMHFAHGGTYTVSLYAFYTLYTLLDLPLAAASLATLLLIAAFGWLTMRVFYEPLLVRGASAAIVMIASLGLFIVIENVVVLTFGPNSRVVSKGTVEPGLLIGSAYVTSLQLWTMGTAAIGVLLTLALIGRSRLGEAIRAMADDSAFAEVIGIDVRVIRALVFALGSLLLAIAAILVSLDVGVIPGSGLRVVLIAAVAAILGGTGTIYGGLVGGILVGLLEAWGALSLDPRWQNVIVFTSLVAVLVLRPAGLLARRV
jgi:branched-chain amino acid transport system permease protein